MMKNKKTIKILIFFAALFFSAGIYAQVSTDAYFPEFVPDSDMEFAERENSFSTKGIQYGGWVTPSFMQKRADDTTSLSTTVLRLWAKTYLWNNAHLYVRGKDTFSVLDIPDENETDNIIDLDLAYLDMFFLNQQLHITLGRKYFMVGTGLVLNGRGDGGEINYVNSYFSLKALVNYTGLLQKDDNPYGLSSADFADGAERLFFGAVVSKNIGNHNVYLFGINQMDLADKDKTEEYNSLYLGGGARGFLLGRLGYYVEFIYEMGDSYTATDEKEDINAMAVSAGCDFKFNVSTEPLLLVEYAYGSGDKDRTESGENGESKDTYFTNFGTFTGGYGLNPKLGNMHVVRGGVSLQPFDWTSVSLLRRITLVGKYSFYMKDKPAASINIGEGTNDERFVGQGIDVSFRWQLLSDVGFFANYGLFLPGDAFESNASNRHFMLAGLNISF